ncbi:hypothetical protein [Myroides odoratus]|uniref:hypothetical protein n=1 Tax=Myroides odoratus TaxID=256 RepID=UPI0007658982|nr:hypothetical protein [Myroides odoratus]
MKKFFFLAVGCAFFTVSCSNEVENNGNLKDNHTKTEMIDYSAIKQSNEYLEFEKRYMEFVKREIDIKQFLYSQESLDKAKAFLIKIGEPNYGGYTSIQDIVSYALAKYLEISNS